MDVCLHCVFNVQVGRWSWEVQAGRWEVELSNVNLIFTFASRIVSVNNMVSCAFRDVVSASLRWLTWRTVHCNPDCLISHFKVGSRSCTIATTTHASCTVGH